MIWRAVGGLAALLTMFGFVPQAVRMWRTKSAKDVSRLTLYQFSIGVFLWMLYGVHLRDLIIICANGTTLLTLIVAIFLHVRYSRHAS